MTYLDAKRGHEVSLTAGFTFNGENPATDYKTGTEFHVEWALMQHVSKTFAFGIAGYHYQQITGDSGAGARIGGFEGRATGLGPDITYTFMCGTTPISTELKYLREFGVENRLTGDGGFGSSPPSRSRRAINVRSWPFRTMRRPASMSASDPVRKSTRAADGSKSAVGPASWAGRPPPRRAR